MMIISKPTTNVRRLLLLPYFLLIISGLMIPSDGSHGFINIKSLAYVATVFSVIIYVIAVKKLVFSQWKIICFLLASMVFLMTWLMVSMFQRETLFESSWDQFKIYWLTISVVTITCYLVIDGLIPFETLLKTLIYANFTYSLLKVGIVILHFAGLIDMWSILKALGMRYMNMGILGNLSRLQTSVDIATPFLVFFFLQSPRVGVTWNKYFRKIYLPVSLIGIFLSFSRFLLGVCCMTIFLHMCTLKPRRILRYIPFLSFLCILGAYYVGSDNISEIVNRRFFSQANSASDDVRIEQTMALMEEYDQYPILGKGLGGYVQDSVRDDKVMHLYEVQWVSFLMQLGLIGILFLLVPVIIISSQILSRPLNRSKVALFFLFIIWLLSGFTNPFLISLTSGILYSLFFLMGRTMAPSEIKV